MKTSAIISIKHDITNVINIIINLPVSLFPAVYQNISNITSFILRVKRINSTFNILF